MAHTSAINKGLAIEPEGSKVIHAKIRRLRTVTNNTFHHLEDTLKQMHIIICALSYEICTL